MQSQMLHDCEEDMSSQIAEKVRESVEAIKFTDVALYQANEKGRNRVLRFSEEMWGMASY